MRNKFEKIQIVEAEQFFAVNINNFTDFVENNDGKFTVSTKWGRVPISDGDWLVFALGECYPVDAISFSNLYRRVKESGA